MHVGAGPGREAVIVAVAQLARALMRDFPDRYHYFDDQRFSYKGRVHRTPNKLLARYRGMDGIKTGYIRASGFNLVASAERDGRRVIAVVFGGKTPRPRNAHMANLLDLGFTRIAENDAKRGRVRYAGIPRPPAGPGLRVDCGVEEGQEVSLHYDPMLAKLVAWGPDRDASLRRLEVALSQFQVLGVLTNIPVLRSLLTHPQFQSGDYDTGFLEWNPAVTVPSPSEETFTLARALAAWAAAQPSLPATPQFGQSHPDHPGPWQSTGPRRLP